MDTMSVRVPFASTMHQIGKVSIKAASTGLLAIFLMSPALAEGVGEELANAFESGSFDLNFRYRYEFVDQDSVMRDANASTLRTRLAYKSGDFRNFFLTINVDDVRPIFADNFNDSRNGKSQYPTVADPKGTDLNLASLTYTGLEDGTIVVGRQRIIRENARFIGNVGWRQNEQTYDSASIDYVVNEDFKVFYGYIDRVKRIFGPDTGSLTAPVENFRSDSHIVDAVYEYSPEFRVVAYGYWLDLENAPGSSSRTTGLRLTGSTGDETRISYSAEYAQQKDYKDNPNDYSEDYIHLTGGVDWSRYGVMAGYEVLQGSGISGQSFQTPLATGHKFNGWADQFLSTPAGGLEDIYVQGSVKTDRGNYSLIYHQFSQETGGNDYGNEWDLVGKWPLSDNYSVLAKTAIFESEDGFSSDVNKVWLMLTADF